MFRNINSNIEINKIKYKIVISNIRKFKLTNLKVLDKRLMLTVNDNVVDIPENQKYYSVTRNVYGLTNEIKNQILVPYKYKPYSYTHLKKYIPASKKKLNIYKYMITKTPVDFALDQLSIYRTISANNIRKCIEEGIANFRERGIPNNQIYIDKIIVIREPSIKSVRFQPYLKTRPVKKRISSLKIVFNEGVPLPRPIKRYYEIIRRLIKYSNPLIIRRKEKRKKIIHWRGKQPRWKRQIK